MSKAQSSTEFVVLTTFMLLVFLSFLLLIQDKMNSSVEEKNHLIAQNLVDQVVNEIKLAESVSDGYERTFTIQNYLEGGMPYEINISGYPSGGELVVRYENKELLYFLDSQISNTSIIQKGKNVITKRNGIVTVSPG